MEMQAGEIALGTAGSVAAAATTAMLVTQSSNNADADESKCKVVFAVN